MFKKKTDKDDAQDKGKKSKGKGKPVKGENPFKNALKSAKK